MGCELCEWAQREDVVLYKDPEVVVAIKDRVATPGHITVFPTQHYTILELAPDAILRRLSEVANKVSVAVFETLGSQGTNIVIRNGLGAGQDIAHFALDVISRQEGDGLALAWNPTQVAQDELERMAELISAEMKSLDTAVVKTAAVKSGVQSEKQSAGSAKSDEDEVNYLIKRSHRIP